jgi:Fe-S oxidoreductase
MVEVARWAYDPRLEPGCSLGVAMQNGVWDCVACHACTAACPQQIDPKQRIVDLREMLVDRPALKGVPAPIRDTNLALMRRGRPHASSGSAGEERLRDAGVRVLSDGERAEWLFFAGCTDWNDSVEAEATCTLAGTLRRGGLDLGTLGSQEICCGDPARFSGEMGLFEHQRDLLVELLQRFDVRKIVTGCPHAFHLLKTAYGLEDIEIRHYVEVLEDLATAGKLRFEQRTDQAVAYHDPCYLGRYSGVYDAPRSLLRRVPGLMLVEMEDARETSLCCGGGGGGAFQEIEAKPRLAWTRARQAIAAGAEVLAVACPYCKQMLTDAAKTLDLPLQVKHVSELVGGQV